MKIRKATEKDLPAIAMVIAEAFEKDFSVFCREPSRVARALEPGVQAHRFYLVELEGKIVGVAAVSDHTGRAVHTNSQAYRKQFGPIKGLFAALALKEEFMAPLTYPATTGYIEFVGVATAARRRGVATALLQYILRHAGYAAYILDVTNRNASAIACYQKLGFVEFERVPAKHPKQMGFDEKIYMRYDGVTENA